MDLGSIGIHAVKRSCLLWCLSLLLGLNSAGYAQKTAGDPIVARATGITAPIKIRASALTRYLNDYPSASAEDAAQRLVDFELLAQLARQQGLDKTPAFVDEQTKALAFTYLRRIFEKKWSASTVPEDDLRRVYDINLIKFIHPDLCNPDHILIGHRPEKGMVMPVDSTLAEAARGLIQKIYAELLANPPRTQVEFLQFFRPFEAETKAQGLLIESQSIGWFSLEKGPLNRGIDPDFARVAFNLKPGEISKPFPTPFGWHIIRQFKCEAAKNQTYEQARTSISERILGDVRKRELGRLSRQLAEQYPPASDGVGLRRLIRLAPLLRAEQKNTVPVGPK